MIPEHLISRECPTDFNPNVIASGCCIIYENKILLLKRHPDKPQGDTWGVPGGKMELNESTRECAIRETHEEAGVDIDDDELKFMGTLYCSVPNGDTPFSYVFHLFQKILKALPVLSIGLEEHMEGSWFTLEEAYNLPLINGGKEVLDYYAESLILNP